MAALNIGMEILYKEAVGVDRIYGHGGFFKTQDVGQQICAAALAAPVYVMQTAGEGGAWGMALLAAYAVQKQGDETLEHYLSEKVFSSEAGTGIEPKPGEIEAFNVFIGRYKAGLAIERAAVETI
jgi:sugar (pentulose or hexulose) kinase